jgi:hypothetical protein
MGISNESSGSLSFDTATVERLNIASNGDISFYEDTGTTESLVWDSSQTQLKITGRETSRGGGVYALDVDNSAQSSNLTAAGAMRVKGYYGDSLIVNGLSDVSFFDNSGNAKFFWDASAESLGIGVVPSSPLHVNVGTNQNLEIDSAGSELRLSAVNDARSANPAIRFQAESYKFYGSGGVGPRATIDSSGNLLVGQSTADSTSTGHGLLATGRAYHTMSSAHPLQLNRKSNDGDIAVFQKDGASVGSIGASGGDLVIGTGDTGIHFHDGVDSIMPWNVSTANYRDAAIDLGTSSYRFKDLYLSSSIRWYSGATQKAYLQYSSGDSSVVNYAASGVGYTFYAGGVRSVDIDASGNLLVGTTSANIYNTTGDQGVAVKTDNVQIQRANNEPLFLNRTGSDGTIASFRKDGTAVGSIGVKGSIPYFLRTSGGIAIGNTALLSAGSTGAVNDAASDLGGSANRWKDLFLSGRVVADGVTTSAHAWSSESNSTSSSAHLYFRNPNGFVGNIATSGTATAYNTSSDYRLKENVVAMTDATERLKQLNPSRFNFIADADKTVDGFLAHEVADVVPEAISGTKDAMINEEYEVAPAVLDQEGNVVTEAVMGTRSVPDYQGIDQSKLVPLLVATIQELEARITQLENN